MVSYRELITCGVWHAYGLAGIDTGTVHAGRHAGCDMQTLDRLYRGHPADADVRAARLNR